MSVVGHGREFINRNTIFQYEFSDSVRMSREKGTSEEKDDLRNKEEELNSSEIFRDKINSTPHKCKID